VTPNSRSDRKPLMAGNWKMNHTHLEAIQVVQKLSYRLDDADYDHCDVVVCPAFTALRSVQTTIDSDRIPIGLGAQDCHWEASGAFTGEVSAPMLAKLNVSFVIVGHSERRELFGETDETVARKVAAALNHDLTPLVCVGEPRSVREAGEAEGFVEAQARASLSRVVGADAGSVVFAYEPVWSIGEGGVPASPGEVAPVVVAIRRAMAESLTGADGRVLYGGSVDETNATDMLLGSGADGLFVGRAAWSAAGFARLLDLCAGLSSQPAGRSMTNAIPNDREVDNAATR
jgi:triosephosphate isomerase